MDIGSRESWFRRTIRHSRPLVGPGGTTDRSSGRALPMSNRVFSGKPYPYSEAGWHQGEHYSPQRPSPVSPAALWSEAACCLGISSYALVIVRHPVRVAESLRHRWQDEASRPAAVVQDDRSHLLWFRYLLEAEQHSQDMLRAWLTYEDLLQAPVHGLWRSLDTLGLPPPRRSAKWRLS